MTQNKLPSNPASYCVLRRAKTAALPNKENSCERPPGARVASTAGLASVAFAGGELLAALAMASTRAEQQPIVPTTWGLF